MNRGRGDSLFKNDGSAGKGQASTDASAEFGNDTFVPTSET